MSAEDTDGECHFRFAEPTVAIEPGNAIACPFTCLPPRQVWLGRTLERRFEVHAAPIGVASSAPLPPRVGVFRQKPWLPWWLALVVPVAVAVAAVLVSLLPKQVDGPEPEGRRQRVRRAEAREQRRLPASAAHEHDRRPDQAGRLDRRPEPARRRQGQARVGGDRGRSTPARAESSCRPSSARRRGWPTRRSGPRSSRSARSARSRSTRPARSARRSPCPARRWRPEPPWPCSWRPRAPAPRRALTTARAVRRKARRPPRRRRDPCRARRRRPRQAGAGTDRDPAAERRPHRGGRQALAAGSRAGADQAAGHRAGRPAGGHRAGGWSQGGEGRPGRPPDLERLASARL